MKIHVICPFMRQHLLATLIDYLEPMNIEWYPIVLEREKFEINIEWIHQIIINDLPEGGLGYKKVNYFIDTYPIVDEDYYCLMGDDDMYEQAFFDEIKKQTADIIYVSLSRGNAIPTYEGVTPHATYPLIITKLEDVRRYNINFAQYIMKGKILKQMRFGYIENCEDGIFAEQLKEKFPNDYIFLPNLFVFSNYFEPERYTNNDWKIKQHWELPKII